MALHRLSTRLDKHVSAHIWGPLDSAKSQIRVLVIEPAPSYQEPLICSLGIVSLLENIPFEALSYTWGVESSDQDILLCDRPWKIKPNLADALRHFRLCQKERFMFVDALCINQNDPEEKNTQVKLMQKVYSTAEKVQCWLGDADGQEELAIETLRVLRLSGPIKLNETQCQALVRFFSKSYWTRAWVLQEISLAREGMISCGTHLIASDELPRWGSLYEASLTFTGSFYRSSEFQVMSMKQRGKYVRTNFPHGMNLLKTIDIIKPILSAIELASNDTTLTKGLSSILCEFSRQNCTMAHDHVYALLGLCRQDFAQSITLVYHDTVANAFWQFAYQWLTFFKDVDILKYANSGSSQVPDLPSWVPDFSKERNPRLERSDCHLANRTTPCFASNDRGWLSTTSFRLDQITAIHRIAPAKSEDPEEFKFAVSEELSTRIQFHTKWRQFLGVGEPWADFECSYIGGGTLEYAYWRLLQKDLQLDLTQTTMLTKWYYATVSDPTLDQDLFKNMDAVIHYNLLLGVILKNKHFFRTAKGWIGLTDCDLGPYTAPTPGDYIYFIPSASFSMLLRPEPNLGENVFKLLGTTFIPGTQRWKGNNDGNPDTSIHPQDRLATAWEPIWIA